MPDDIFDLDDGLDIYTGRPRTRPSTVNRFAGPWPMPAPHALSKAQRADAAARQSGDTPKSPFNPLSGH